MTESTTGTKRITPPGRVLHSVCTARVSTTSRSISNSYAVPRTRSNTKIATESNSANVRLFPYKKAHRIMVSRSRQSLYSVSRWFCCPPRQAGRLFRQLSSPRVDVPFGDYVVKPPTIRSGKSTANFIAGAHQVVTWVVLDRRVRPVYYRMSGYGGSGERRAAEVLIR